MLRYAILVIGLFLFVVLMGFFPFLQSMVAIGDNLTPFTANVSHWEGYREINAMVPLIVIVFFIGMVGVAWWRARWG